MIFECRFFFCFFKQKTAYEMRISDWSSDVCSSDLQPAAPALPRPHTARLRAARQALTRRFFAHLSPLPQAVIPDKRATRARSGIHFRARRQAQPWILATSARMTREKVARLSPPPQIVMRGLVPGLVPHIHAATARAVEKWALGSSPRVTADLVA